MKPSVRLNAAMASVALFLATASQTSYGTTPLDHFDNCPDGAEVIAAFDKGPGNHVKLYSCEDNTFTECDPNQALAEKWTDTWEYYQPSFPPCVHPNSGGLLSVPKEVLFFHDDEVACSTDGSGRQCWEKKKK